MPIRPDDFSFETSTRRSTSSTMPDGSGSTAPLWTDGTSLTVSDGIEPTPSNRTRDQATMEPGMIVAIVVSALSGLVALILAWKVNISFCLGLSTRQMGTLLVCSLIDLGSYSLKIELNY